MQMLPRSYERYAKQYEGRDHHAEVETTFSVFLRFSVISKSFFQFSQSFSQEKQKKIIKLLRYQEFHFPPSVHVHVKVAISLPIFQIMVAGLSELHVVPVWCSMVLVWCWYVLWQWTRSKKFQKRNGWWDPANYALRLKNMFFVKSVTIIYRGFQ